MTEFVIVALIVLFGAALMGKMLMDMYPGSVLDMLKKNDIKDAPPAE